MAHDAEGRQLQAATSQTAPTRRKSQLSLLDAPEILERKSIQSDAKSNLSRDERVSNNGHPDSALSDPVSSYAPAAVTPPGLRTVPQDLNTIRTIPGMAEQMQPRSLVCGFDGLPLTSCSLGTIYSGNNWRRRYRCHFTPSPFPSRRSDRCATQLRSI